MYIGNNVTLYLITSFVHFVIAILESSMIKLEIVFMVTAFKMMNTIFFDIWKRKVYQREIVSKYRISFECY